MKRNVNITDSLSYLIKPASSSCNLRCPYCFYLDLCQSRSIPNFGKMTQETVENLIDGAFLALRDGGTLNFAFQGGEPTLAGISFFETFVNFVNFKQSDDKRLVVNYSLQTNGTTLNEAWCSFLKTHNFLLGISLDGYQENTDTFRIDIRKIGQYSNIMKGIALLKSFDIDFNIITVLTKQLALNPEKLYRFYKDHEFKYVQIIPCLPELFNDESVDALDPENFASFYKAFFDFWYTDYKRGDLMSVGLFDNIIPMYLGIRPFQCGMLGQCAPQLVIEGDGSVYPCDFYVLDQYVLGNVNTHDVSYLMRNSCLNKFLSEPKRKSSACESCKFVSMCHGNCKRQNVVLFNDEGYCGYQDFLGYSFSRMVEIAKTISEQTI